MLKNSSLGKSQGGTLIIAQAAFRQIFGRFWTKILSERKCRQARCGTQNSEARRRQIDF